MVASKMLIALIPKRSIGSSFDLFIKIINGISSYLLIF